MMCDAEKEQLPQFAARFAARRRRERWFGVLSNMPRFLSVEMKMNVVRISVLVAACGASFLFSGSAQAGPVSIDGIIGAEWAGATLKTVSYDSAASTGNFGTPGTTNHQTAYDIRTRGDGNFVYVGLSSASSTGGLDFANLYFDTNPSTGSDVGFEVTNNRAFKPGVPGYYNYTPGAGFSGIEWSLNTAPTGSTLEFAVPVSFFTSDPLGIGFPQAVDKVQLRLSQTFGYSVAGGSSFGSDRLGEVSVTAAVVPLPAAAWMGMALMSSVGGMGLLRKRARVS